MKKLTRIKKTQRTVLTGASISQSLLKLRSLGDERRRNQSVKAATADSLTGGNEEINAIKGILLVHLLTHKKSGTLKRHSVIAHKIGVTRPKGAVSTFEGDFVYNVLYFLLY